MFYCDIPEYNNISFLFNYLNFWVDAFIAIIVVLFTDFFYIVGFIALRVLMSSYALSGFNSL